MEKARGENSAKTHTIFVLKTLVTTKSYKHCYCDACDKNNRRESRTWRKIKQAHIGWWNKCSVSFMPYIGALQSRVQNATQFVSSRVIVSRLWRLFGRGVVLIDFLIDWGQAINWALISRLIDSDLWRGWLRAADSWKTYLRKTIVCLQARKPGMTLERGRYLAAGNGRTKLTDCEENVYFPYFMI